MQKEFKSVWDAIEYDPGQATNLRLRSQLMTEVSEYVRYSGLTQTEAASSLGTTQLHLNDVIKGRIEKCTVERLVNMLTAAGYSVDLDISHTA